MIERWSWLGEPLAIDFANTVRRQGFEYVEFLCEPRDLVEWARYERLRLRERDVGSRLDEVRELRDAVFALLGASSKPRAAPPASAAPHAAPRSAATPRPARA